LPSWAWRWSQPGGLIELVQGTPFIARDASFYDWLVDIVGVGIGVGLVAAIRSRLSLWPAT